MSERELMMLKAMADAIIYGGDIDFGEIKAKFQGIITIEEQKNEE